MSITAEKKADIIKKNANKKGDTGSPEVNVIAILSERITALTGHFQDSREGQPLASRAAQARLDEAFAS